MDSITREPTVFLRVLLTYRITSSNYSGTTVQYPLRLPKPLRCPPIRPCLRNPRSHNMHRLHRPKATLALSNILPRRLDRLLEYVPHLYTAIRNDHCLLLQAPLPPQNAVPPPLQNATRPQAPQSLNPVRPPKPGRRKDVNPFIVPKKKRP